MIIFVLIMPASWFFSNSTVQKKLQKKISLTKIVIWLLGKLDYPWIILWNLPSSNCCNNSLVNSFPLLKWKAKKKLLRKILLSPQVVRADMQDPLVKK